MESEFTVPPYSEYIYCIDEAARLPHNLSASKVITPQRPVVQILINLNSDLISTLCSIQNNKVPNQADIFPTNCKLLISVTFVFSRWWNPEHSSLRPNWEWFPVRNMSLILCNFLRHCINSHLSTVLRQDSLSGYLEQKLMFTSNAKIIQCPILCGVNIPTNFWNVLIVWDN
jgi:hypothetical protein